MDEAVRYFDLLRGEVGDLFDLAKTFESLFHEDVGHADRKELTTRRIMERTAPRFFSQVNDVLHRYLVLQTSRLADPPKSIGRENISIPGMNDRLTALTLMTSEIQQLSVDLLAFIAIHAKVPRNRYLGHNDFRSILAQLTLGGSTEAEAQAFFSNLQTYCDAVGRRLGIGPLDLRPGGCAGDELDLIRSLKYACRIRDECVSAECAFQKFDIRPTRYYATFTRVAASGRSAPKAR